MKIKKSKRLFAFLLVGCLMMQNASQEVFASEPETDEAVGTESEIAALDTEEADVDELEEVSIEDNLPDEGAEEQNAADGTGGYEPSEDVDSVDVAEDEGNGGQSSEEMQGEESDGVKDEQPVEADDGTEGDVGEEEEEEKDVEELPVVEESDTKNASDEESGESVVEIEDTVEAKDDKDNLDSEVYVIEYRIAEGQEDWGAVSVEREEVSNIEEIKGATAEANEGYEFIGWADREGLPFAEEVELVPTVLENAIFYAQFSPVLTSEITYIENAVYYSASTGVSLTGNKREDICKIAYDELGKTDATRYYESGESGPWCAFFARWCARQAGLDATKWPTAGGSTTCLIRFFQSSGRWHNRDLHSWSYNGAKSTQTDDGYVPHKGDFAAVENDGDQCPNHTALVYNVNESGGYFETIEGNIGKRVVKRKYSLSNLYLMNGEGGVYVVGFGTPDYGDTVEPTNHTPQGWLDGVNVSEDSVNIYGWAKDSDDANRAVEIRMEIGGNTYTTTANQSRSDVGAHGFNATFKVNCSGTQTLNVYAVDADINQKYLLSGGSRTVTIQRSPKLEYGVSKLEIPYGSMKKLSFTYQGDGITSMSCSTGDGRIASATSIEADWASGSGSVTVKSGTLVGSTSLTVYFFDSNSNKIYQKSIPVTITGDFGISFTPKINYLREKEEYQVNFTISGTGFSQIDYSISDKNIVQVLRWRDEGYDAATGECGLVVKGVKADEVEYLYIKLRDVNGEVVYEDSCVLWVREGLDISFGSGQMKVSKGNKKSYSVTFKGYAVSDVSVESEDTDIAAVSLAAKNMSEGTATITVVGNSAGKTKLYFKLLDKNGGTLLQKAATVTVEEAFNIRFEDSAPLLWLGETNNINFTLEDNYSGIYGLEYVIEEGENVIEEVNHGGDENGGRWVSLKGLKSGAALFTVRISGLSGSEEVVLYEKSITVCVIELKAFPSAKTAYVGESFQMDSYCIPVTPTNLELTYSSSDTAIATVTSQGKVTAKKKGNADITAATADGKHTAKCAFTVIEENVGVTGISVSPTAQKLTVGDMYAINVSFQPSNATNTQFSCQSSNTDVATVNKYGIIEAVGVGNARITVTSADGNKTAYCDVTVGSAVVASGKTGELDWKITGEEGDYTLTISGTGVMPDYEGPESEGDAPWYQYHESLKHLVLEEGITRIGKCAFACCDSLTGKLDLPESLTSIGASAFFDCNSLSGTLDLPDSLVSIDSGAFYGCRGFSGNIVIPDGITRIASGTFEQCSGFDGTLSIPESVISIGDSAFCGCSGLTGELVLPDGLTSIEPWAFRNCHNLSGNLVFPEGLEEIGGLAFYGCSGFTGNLKLPPKLTKISQFLFCDCTGLDGTLELPENITQIELAAFKNTRFSSAITIPEKVTRIYGYAFYDIPGLKVYFEGDAPEYIKEKDHKNPSFFDDVQLYYDLEKTGWSTPEWNGYDAEPISEDNPGNIQAERVGLELSGVYLSVGDSQALKYEVYPESAIDKNVVWESSDVSVVTVDDDGVIEAISPGEAYITVSTKNGKDSKCCEILVEEKPSPTLYIDFDEPELCMWTGETATLSFKCGGRGFTAVAQVIYDKDIAQFVEWGEREFNDTGEGVHRITHGTLDMVIKGISPGKTTIAVQLQENGSNLLYQKLADITVMDLELSDYFKEMTVGEVYDGIHASAYPNGDSIGVTYESNDETVATVDETGIVTALQPGMAVITVTSTEKGLSKECSILISEEGANEKEYRQVSEPTANFENGSSVDKGTEIILSCVNDDAAIYYTMDGTDPTRESILYTEPIAINEAMTIKAFAVKEGYKDSDIVTFNYTVTDAGDDELKLSPPKANYETGSTVAAGTQLTLTSGEGASIYYTIDGTEPTRDSILYTEPLTINSDVTIKAFSVKDGYQDSDVVTFKYTILKNGSTDDSSDVLSEDIPAGGIPNGLWIAGIDEEGYAYTGETIKPEVRVYDGSTLLKEKTDYTVSYKNNKSVGTATVTVTSKGNYSGKETVTFDIIPVDMGSGEVYAMEFYVKTGGKAQKPVPELYYMGMKLKNNRDFTVSYSNASNIYAQVGEYGVTVTGKGNYTGTRDLKLMAVEKIVKPKPVSIAKAALNGFDKSFTYTGKACRQECTLTVKTSEGEKTLAEGMDYTVRYANNVKAGTATVTYYGRNGYTGKLKKTYKILPYDILNDQNAKIKYENNFECVYAKGGSKPNPIVTFDGKAMKEGVDYTLSYKNNKAVAGNKTPCVVVNGKGCFKGKISINFTIKAQDLSKMTLVSGDRVYKNKANIYKITPKLMDSDGKLLSSGKDFDQKSITYVYENDVELENGVYKKAGSEVEKTDIIPAGTQIRITLNCGSGSNYTGTFTGTYRITKADIKSAKVTIPKQLYTGGEITLDKSQITVKLSGDTLKPEDYEIIRYADNVKKGKASVTIKGKGDYGGVKTVKFTIGAKGFLWWWRK